MDGTRAGHDAEHGRRIRPRPHQRHDPEQEEGREQAQAQGRAALARRPSGPGPPAGPRRPGQVADEPVDGVGDPRARRAARARVRASGAERGSSASIAQTSTGSTPRASRARDPGEPIRCRSRQARPRHTEGDARGAPPAAPRRAAATRCGSSAARPHGPAATGSLGTPDDHEGADADGRPRPPRPAAPPTNSSGTDAGQQLTTARRNGAADPRRCPRQRARSGRHRQCRGAAAATGRRAPRRRSGQGQPRSSPDIPGERLDPPEAGQAEPQPARRGTPVRRGSSAGSPRVTAGARAHQPGRAPAAPRPAAPWRGRRRARRRRAAGSPAAARSVGGDPSTATARPARSGAPPATPQPADAGRRAPGAADARAAPRARRLPTRTPRQPAPGPATRPRPSSGPCRGLPGRQLGGELLARLHTRAATAARPRGAATVAATAATAPRPLPAGARTAPHVTRQRVRQHRRHRARATDQAGRSRRRPPPRHRCTVGTGRQPNQAAERRQAAQRQQAITGRAAPQARRRRARRRPRPPRRT